ncbi:MAG: tRNA (5-methylaminomethyl-2-thiouridine)(34)-methyltransferase MnmD [Flavobacteriaceae bacterium]
MQREIITTADGSITIHIKDWDEHYHSIHGAIQEAYHVFIAKGLALFENRKLSILELGFGTGLNALITYLETEKRCLKIDYTGIEKYPISDSELQALNYISALHAESHALEFSRMHLGPWNEQIALSENFNFTKIQVDFKEIAFENAFDLVYFDAFGARVQPELWTEDIFAAMYLTLKPGGILVTYAAKGSVRRAMLAVGFEVERLPGPPGKREMLRATKCSL